ncbi:MAG: aminotransferase class I/II-fold pyridoxal phosphate-dependent enzyme [Clostridiales bacterium]|nr:aminotransferase class I/II-fold pyridoxal phosphate-dependent enzyme [Clostridiales bacterium]
MSKTLQDALEEMAAKQPDRFTVPGHKGTLCPLDFTELGLRGELFPDTLVVDAEKETAKLYGVQNLFYLTHGSSLGIKAALYRFKGKEVLYADGVHRAFTEACELWDIKKVPVGEERDGFDCAADAGVPPITYEQAAHAIATHPNASALFITSPDYMGRCADRAIATFCKEKGVTLIVDAAHGAHFAFAPDLDEYRFETVAPLCNMSAHKTLAAYTQGAYLAAATEEAESVEKALRLLGTTSPNYLLLSSLSEAAKAAAGQKNDYLRLKAFSEKMHEQNICLPNQDYTRLCVTGRKYKGKALFAYCTAHNVLPETAIGEWVVFVLTPYDNGAKLKRLENLLQQA